MSAYVLLGLCLVFAVMGYRKGGRKGYLFVAAFAALMVLAPLAQPVLRHIAFWRAERVASEFMQEMQKTERLDAEVNKAIYEIYKREGITVAPISRIFFKHTFTLRLDLLLLAFGLWYLQSTERPKPAATNEST
jgi:hypothetical protein